MEKLRDSFSSKLPPLRLYFDELHEIYEVLLNHNAESVTIETCGYRITDFEELKKLPNEETHELYLNSNKPYLQIRLAQTHGEIYIGDGSLESEGLLSRIEKILIRGKIFYLSPTNNNWLAYLSWIPLFFGLFLQNNVLIAIGVFLTVLILVWALLHYNFAMYRYNTIILKSRKETPSFWKRNKDQLVMLAIGAVIGAVVTKVVDLLLK